MSQNNIHKFSIDIQGHRGARGLFPENTLTAFREALKIGVNTLELDVVVSKDNQLVVSHEPWMSEMICSKPDGHPVEKNAKELYNIFKMSYAEIRQFDCGKRGNPNFPDQKTMSERKPLLSEVIEAAEAYCSEHNIPPVQYNIETKSVQELDYVYNPNPKTFITLLYTELKKHKILERTMIQSFDVRTLQELKKTDPSVRISLLVENTLGIDNNIKKLGFKPDIYSPDFHLLTKQSVEHLHALRVQVIPWTINREPDMKRLVSMGIDGFITDFPDKAVELFKK